MFFLVIFFIFVPLIFFLLQFIWLFQPVIGYHLLHNSRNYLAKPVVMDDFFSNRSLNQKTGWLV